MNQTIGASAVALALALSACTVTAESISSSASGEVVRTITSSASGGGSPFDGTVDQASDLDDLVATAWGVGSLGLHRGHRPIFDVLEAFLGINHKEMHVLMEDEGMNLAAVCKHLGFESDNLIESLTASFVPHVEQGVKNGVIKSEEVSPWMQKIRDAFTRRVNWTG